MRILLASNNPHKAAEMRAILEGMDLHGEGLAVLVPGDLPAPPHEPVEDGDTLEANAYIKAAETFAATRIPTIADDTGLEVDALSGAPGVMSARYAGENVTYDDNCARLLRDMEGVAAERRTARFRTVICYTDGLRTLFAEGTVEGLIATAPRGSNGFGYDPLFVPFGGDRTFAEMNADAKNAISHRGRALLAFKDILAPYLTTEQR